MAKAAEKTPETEPEAERTPPPILGRHVTIQKHGSVWSEWEVNAPEGLTPDDLENPEVWKKVQGDRQKALKRRDEIRVVGFDGTWIAKAIVCHASQIDVILSRPVITKMLPPTETLLEDDLYRVIWAVGGYVVERKRDGQKMSHVTHSAAAAARDLDELYPVKVAR